MLDSSKAHALIEKIPVNLDKIVQLESSVKLLEQARAMKAMMRSI